MKKALYNNEISPRCDYCETGKMSQSGSEVLCRKMGVMQPDSSCKKFRYDPLKRVPKTVKLASGFTEKDFEL